MRHTCATLWIVSEKTPIKGRQLLYYCGTEVSRGIGERWVPMRYEV